MSNRTTLPVTIKKDILNYGYGEFIPDDDYIPIYPPNPQPGSKKKGIQCTLCGMKFDTGETYLYSCSRPKCPVYPQGTMLN